MYKIVADSSCDILEIPGILFEAVPLTISTKEKSYVDDASLNCHEMLNYLASYKDRSYTACPSTALWASAFEGSDEIYVVTMTSGLSGTYNSACLAARLFQESHPDVQICVIDTLSTGPEMHLIIEKIIELKKRDFSMKEVSASIHSYMQSTRLFFAFTSLHNFAQNGRVNKVLASTIGMLGISILGTASEKGTIAPIGKCRGDKKVIAQLLNEMLAAGYMNGKVRICEIENRKLAEKLAHVIRLHFPDADISIYPARGICSYYGERGGVIVSCECC